LFPYILLFYCVSQHLLHTNFLSRQAIKGTDGAELPFNNAAVARGGDPSAASSGDDADDDEDE